MSRLAWGRICRLYVTALMSLASWLSIPPVSWLLCAHACCMARVLLYHSINQSIHLSIHQSPRQIKSECAKILQEAIAADKGRSAAASVPWSQATVSELAVALQSVVLSLVYQVM